MAQINRSQATLRIVGDSLDPKDISRILGCEGTTMYSKGDFRTNIKTGKKIEWQTGHWSLSAKVCEPGDVDSQVVEIFNCLTMDMSVWVELSDKYYVELFCGLFMKQESEGIGISSKSMAVLGERGIELFLDIYDGTE